MMNKEISFRYGVIYGDLEQQANEQGYTLGRKQGKLEAIRKAINSCLFSGVATNNQVNMMFKKLQKKVVEALEERKNK